MSDGFNPAVPRAAASAMACGWYHSSIASLPHPIPVSTKMFPSGCRITQACTGYGSNVSYSGCHSGTEVTVASISRSICGSFDRGTRSKLLLALPQNAGPGTGKSRNRDPLIGTSRDISSLWGLTGIPYLGRQNGEDRIEEDAFMPGVFVLTDSSCDLEQDDIAPF